MSNAENLEKEEEKINEELNNKSNEELIDIANKTLDEQMVQVDHETHTYIYNIMEINKIYDKDDYENTVLENDKKYKDNIEEKFSNVDRYQELESMDVLLIGYQDFGKEFIKLMLEKDPESLKLSVEVLINNFLDLLHKFSDLNTVIEAYKKLSKEESNEEKLNEEKQNN